MSKITTPRFSNYHSIWFTTKAGLARSARFATRHQICCDWLVSHGLPLQADGDGLRLKDHPSVSLRAACGSVMAQSGLAIDASLTDLAGQQAALKLARTLASGWISLVCALPRSTAVVAGGRVVARLETAGIVK